MKIYLSFGGGVNSIALYILLEREGVNFEAVFADHGADWPHTYEYVEWMQENGHPVTRLKARRDGLSLYDYYWEHKMIPMRMMRHCTDHFKIRPLLKSYDEPYIEYIGFDAGEAHRAERFRRKETVEFPLIDRGIDRDGCLEIIKDAGWGVPKKSGCFLCSYQSVGQWEALPRKYPELYQKAIALERRCCDRLAEQGRPPMYLAHPFPVEVMCAGRYARRLWRKQQKGQMNLWGLADLEQCPYCRI